MDDPSPARPTDLTWLLIRAAQHLRAELDSVARAHGLAGLRDWVVLAALDAHRGRTQLQLGGELGVDKTTLTLVLDRLERDGLAVRRNDPADRRARIPEITDDGRALQGRIALARDRAEAALLSCCTDQEQQQLRSLLTRLAGPTGAGGPVCTAAAACTEAPARTEDRATPTNRDRGETA
ncbi:MarR family winged helix-turn-helix transcriptional regulator [Streptomyces sp. NPDC092296]|uniref:MarR family winged helix-turn-helix transcriptional regulator n=1 Tax=Streptomyces sp. NPDC092296 TaxID=3366012 RepID=UPI0038127FB5